jgi:hypothetical protein
MELRLPAEGVAMPVLPLIDLMILLAWTSLIVAFVQKAMGMALATRPVMFGMGPFDFVLVAGVSLLFALALAARVWVKATEPGLLRLRRERNGNGGFEVLPDFPDPRTSHGLATSPRAGEAEAAPTRLAAR